MLGNHQVESSSASRERNSTNAPWLPGRLVGRMVVDQHDGMRIGDVDVVFVDHVNGEPRYLRLSTGGILGIGKTYVLVPMNAVVGIEDERILIDPRLTLVSGGDDKRQPRWDIPPRTSVLAADDGEIGKVVEIHRGFVVAERGVYFAEDFYIPNDAITLYCGQYVRLTMTTDNAMKQGWDIAPPLLVRAARVD